MANINLKNYQKLNSDSSFLFLKHASALNMTEQDKTILNTLCKKISDWQRLFDLAEYTGLAGLVYYNLKKNNLIELVENFDCYEKVYNKYLFHNIKVFHVYENISKKLTSEKIDHIPLKGVYLLKNVYQNIGVRYTSDVDILLKSEDTERYLKIFDVKKIRYKAACWFTKYISETARTKNVLQISIDGVSVDLHEHVHNRKYHPLFRINHFWSNSRPIIEKSYERELSPEYLILLLTVHCFFHLTKRILDGTHFRFVWFVDIAEVIKSNKVNWEKVIALANEYRCELIVLLILYCVNYYLLSKDESQPLSKFLTKEFESHKDHIDTAFKYAFYGDPEYRNDCLGLLNILEDYQVKWYKKIPFVISTWIPSRIYFKINYDKRTLSDVAKFYPYWLVKRINNNHIR